MFVQSLWIFFVFYRNLDADKTTVVLNKTICSVTCGLGIQTRTVCDAEKNETNMQSLTENLPFLNIMETSCRVETVVCQKSLKCGISTRTVFVGQKVDIDCVEEEIREVLQSSWRIEWRHARGIITVDDSLFARWDVPESNRLTLNPVREADAGTYRCLMLDKDHRRVKRMYWGIRVVVPGFINLDYESARAQWEQEEEEPSALCEDLELAYKVLYGFGAAVALCALMFPIIFFVVRCR